MTKQEAARNIRFALEGVGVDSDIATHQGFELVADFTETPFHEGSEWHNEYLQAADALNDELPILGEVVDGLARSDERDPASYGLS